MIRYRLIHFVPDRVQGGRFPIAAALYDGTTVTLVEADRLPGPTCLGGELRAASLSMLRESLRSIATFDRLPTSAGPHALLDSVRELPAGVNDAVAWLRKHVLAADELATPSKQRISHPRRASYGDQFFTRWNVREHVKKTFRPKSDLGGWLANESNTLEQVSHWVPGHQEVFLMEPIVPARDSFEDDVRTVGQRFWGYKGAIENRHANDKRTIIFIAYILKGGSRDAREHALSSLRSPCDRVVDASNDVQASEFTSRIREVSLSARAQGEFEPD